MTMMTERGFVIGSYANEWIKYCRKNGLAIRVREDVERQVKDIMLFRRIVRLEDLFLHECESHYVLSTSEVNLIC